MLDKLIVKRRLDWGLGFDGSAYLLGHRDGVLCSAELTEEATQHRVCLHQYRTLGRGNRLGRRILPHPQTGEEVVDGPVYLLTTAWLCRVGGIESWRLLGVPIYRDRYWLSRL